MRNKKWAVLLLGILFAVSLLSYYFVPVFGSSHEVPLELATVTGDEKEIDGLHITGELFVEGRNSDVDLTNTEMTYTQHPLWQSQYVSENNEFSRYREEYPSFLRGKNYGLYAETDESLYFVEAYMDKQMSDTIHLPFEQFEKETEEVKKGSITIELDEPILSLYTASVLATDRYLILDMIVDTATDQLELLYIYDLQAEEVVDMVEIGTSEDGYQNTSTEVAILEEDNLELLFTETTYPDQNEEGYTESETSKTYGLYQLEDKEIKTLDVPADIGDLIYVRTVIYNGSIYFFDDQEKLAIYQYDPQTNKILNQAALDLEVDLGTQDEFYYALFLKKDDRVLIHETYSYGENQNIGIAVIDLNTLQTTYQGEINAASEGKPLEGSFTNSYFE